MIRRLLHLLWMLCLLFSTVSGLIADVLEVEGGRRERMNGYLVVHLQGTPEQMGRQHGLLLKREVQRMIRDLLLKGECSTETEHTRLLRGAMVMEKYLEPEFRRELRALAEAAEVEYPDLVLAQLFGDVQRAERQSRSFSPNAWAEPRPPAYLDDSTHLWECTSFAVFGPATKTGECIVGRNMDFWDHGVSEWGGVLIHFRPDHGIPFMTTSWAGIINGWTALNLSGLVCANNTSYDSRSDSLEGLSTCFMVRKVAQYAHNVEEGVKIVETTPRACGTNLLIAGGTPPNAAIVEYDHEQLAVRWAQDGYITAANDFEKLYQSSTSYSYYSSRSDRLRELIKANYGQIDRSMNFAAAEGVPLRSINLHSAILFTCDLRFNISMTLRPAADHWYRPFRLTPEGLEPVRLNEAWGKLWRNDREGGENLENGNSLPVKTAAGGG
ncbi:MAG: C45 family autoproteolytic acyltransferase/hydrolase [Candidatus Zipacnadales bacterium]